MKNRGKGNVAALMAIRAAIAANSKYMGMDDIPCPESSPIDYARKLQVRKRKRRYFNKHRKK